MKVEPNPKALLPILIILILYIAIGISVRSSAEDLSVPVVAIFLVGLLAACIQNRKTTFDHKIATMAAGVGNKNIIMMILIFLCAGAFVGIVGRSSAESVAYLLLDSFPPELSVAVIFIASMAVSLAMGTSVGTITLLTPIAVNVSLATGFSIPLCVGSVVGGAMFGDNLSFISDTTVAACQGQGCRMKDKFRENVLIAVPAALISIIIFAAISTGSYNGGYVHHEYDLVLIIPYVIVLLLSVSGVNVFASLLAGMISGAAIVLLTGTSDASTILSGIETGIESMYETIIVAVTVSAIIALVIEYGGFEAVMERIRKTFRSVKGGMIGIGVLVGIMDVSTANNTVAIVMSNPLAKEISKEYDISASRTASILDSFSCVVQGIIPYGAQLMTATSTISAIVGAGVYYATDIVPFVIYPLILLAAYLAYIMFFARNNKNKAD